MKKVIPFQLLLLFAISTNAQTTTWIDQLQEFSSAVYQRDKEKTKQFFKFPVTDREAHSGVYADMMPEILFPMVNSTSC